ncbi:MAG: hypothetical protein QXN26_06555 [Thermoplasmataceae archaeon]
MEHNDREFQSQSFYVDNNLRVEKAIDSFLYLPGFQSSFGIENNMLDPKAEDIDDPDYLSEVELIEIEASLKDYSEGKFKRGSIDELLKDLKD